MATDEAADVLRHGWQDAARNLAPDIPEVAELLQARLEIAIASDQLDEDHLLETIQEVESLTSRAGSPQGQVLARRLRRTVYEYLLALDAVRPSAHLKASIEQTAPASDGPLVGAEEIAAMGHPSGGRGGTGRAEGTQPRRHQPAAVPVFPGPEIADEADADESERGPYADTPFDAPLEEPLSLSDTERAQPEPPEPAEALAPADATTAPGTGFVAPRAGFHILEEAEAPMTSGTDQPPLPMPAFASDLPDPAPEVPGSEFLPWPRSTAGPPPPAETSGAAAPAGVGAGGAPPTPPDAGGEEEDEEDGRGWSVRRPGDRRPTHRALGGAPIEDDPFENNPKLADRRRRIEDRLRRRRCDEAAALLQELAQETGGRSVAELAMNAGDRCRTLGKSNAALNCYLAAARADPVYELPLSRLADICIDNQDTELAVTYLERIARLYRFRGDDKSALRMYRRIATVAPYREDVLTLLMNAQTTGRLE